jgi:hypothetical protein
MFGKIRMSQGVHRKGLKIERSFATSLLFCRYSRVFGIEGYGFRSEWICREGFRYFETISAIYGAEVDRVHPKSAQISNECEQFCDLSEVRKRIQ